MIQLVSPVACLLTTAIDPLRGDLSDRGPDALRAGLSTLKGPRGSLEFDAHRQVISPIYVMRTEKQGYRIVNANVDRIPAVSQEATWTWHPWADRPLWRHSRMRQASARARFAHHDPRRPESTPNGLLLVADRLWGGTGTGDR